MRSTGIGILAIAAAIGGGAVAATAEQGPSAIPVNPASLRRIGTVDDRYQSYNVEMLEVTGGRFWRPYGPEFDAILKEGRPASASGGQTPAGMDPRLYEYRPPIDLSNARLRKLAAALGPAYVRVSGTWANTTYLADADQAPSSPPAGYGAVLTRQQWKGVIDFSRAVNARIVTSFATGVGTRDPSGAWTPNEAKRFVEYTTAAGGSIAAAEFMNEPNIAAMGGAPKGYDAAAYGRDFKTFEAFARESTHGMMILGPGSVGEGNLISESSSTPMPIIRSRDMLAASAPASVDAVSYHHYGAVSRRCAAMGMQTTAEAALSEEWLRRTDDTLAVYRKLRDEFAPGKPFWLTETADAACGGNPWGKTFLDSFRYVDQLGRLAREDVRVVIHNTLAASDYGLLDEKTFTPRPNYWAALLWRKLMGPTVLDAGIPIREGLHVYAQCLQGGAQGGVALLAINNSRTDAHALAPPLAADRYTLTGQPLDTRDVRLNGRPLALRPDNQLPDMAGDRVAAGTIPLPAASITFLAIPDAANPSCR
jgi:hypothetical protein